MMAIPRNRKFAVMILAVCLALSTFWLAVSVEVLTFRVLLTESGLYLEGIFDDIKTTQVQFTSQRGRFWSAPGISIAWPMFAIAIPHWLHITAALTWLLWPMRRNNAGDRICLACGYNLKGNESGKCPECGAAIKDPTQPD